MLAHQPNHKAIPASTHGVDRLCGVLVQPHKLFEQEGTRRIVAVPALELRESVSERRMGDFGAEEIDLIEKEDDGCLGEPPADFS